MIARQVLAPLTSLMARDAISDADDAFSRLKLLSLQNLSARELVTGEAPNEYLEAKAKEKGRRWHTRQNVAPGLPTPGALSPQVRAYRDASGRP